MMRSLSMNIPSGKEGPEGYPAVGKCRRKPPGKSQEAHDKSHEKDETNGGPIEPTARQ
jgi:hypothetical protein